MVYDGMPYDPIQGRGHTGHVHSYSASCDPLANEFCLLQGLESIGSPVRG